MKAIGILTFCQSINYGACLQTFALRKYLENNGFNAVIIDYVPNYENEDDPRNILQRIRSWVWEKTLRRFLRDYKRISKTITFKEKYFKFTKKRYFDPKQLRDNSENFVCCIVGSDQVWNPRYVGSDMTWFLDFTDTKRIAYAASFGISELPPKYVPIYRRYLQDFDNITVREETGANIVKDLIGVKPEVVLDPVFLIDKHEWQNMAVSVVGYKYVLCYYMPGFPDVEKKIAEIAKKYAKETNATIVNIGKHEISKLKFWENNCFGISPEEFLGLVNGAEMVITNSFHGTAFSLIFGKKFISVVNDKNNIQSNVSSRIVDLLSKIGGLEHLCRVNDLKVPGLDEMGYDYKQLIEQEKQKSKLFLKRVLEVNGQ